MIETFEKIQAFYTVDQSTFLVILLFCCGAAYSVRNHLTNPASVWFLGALFFSVALTTYVLAQQMQMFSPKRTIEWITYSTFSAAIGAIMGILCVAIFRVVQERLIRAHHIRQTLKRDEEQTARGYPAVDL
jgi:NhaP-type Na+/H+ or K+/H+ antiporter